MLIIKGNKDLGYTLRKNPNNQNSSHARPNKPLSKEWRQGVFKLLFINNGVGYDPSIEGEVECRIWLVENPDKSSFGELSLISTDHLCSPELYVGMLDTLLRSAYREKEEHDGPCTIQFALKIRETKLKSFTLDYKEIGNSIFWVTHSSTSVYESVNWLLALCFASMSKLYWDKTNVDKCRNLLKRFSLTGTQIYHISKGLPQDLAVKLNGFNPDLELVGGNTQLQRLQVFKKHLLGGSTLYDLGCGHNPQSRKLIGRYKKIVQVDKAYNLKSMSDDVIFINEDISNIDIEEQSHVLLAEVLEHNSKEFAQELVSNLLKKASKIVISVPNIGFNSVWNSDEYRHHDHQWEPTIEELEDLLPKVDTHTLSIEGIGDRLLLNDRRESISLLAVYTEI